MGTLPILAYLIDWGWLRIGLPYIYINIDPVIFNLGPLALRWYGLMYVVGIVVGLWCIRGYTARKGLTQNVIYRVLWWCVAAGLLGGRLYFVIQQPDFVSHYLQQPQHILATWEGGMAFFGAIFLVIPTIFWRARVERVNPLVAIDAGVLFATAGQIFGRIGNLVNGDIIGYRSTLPWSTVYQNLNSWACLNPSTCNVPVQPAAAYELLTNIVLLACMFYLARRVRRPGVLMLVYLYAYAITQFLLFFVRDNLIVTFLGLNWGLKQAQWTSIVLFIGLLPITYLVFRYSRPVPEGEVAATYGIPQKPEMTATGGTSQLIASREDQELAEEQVVEAEDVGAELIAPREDQEPPEEQAVEAQDVEAELIAPREDQERIEEVQVEPGEERLEAQAAQTQTEKNEEELKSQESQEDQKLRTEAEEDEEKAGDGLQEDAPEIIVRNEEEDDAETGAEDAQKTYSVSKATSKVGES